MQESRSLHKKPLNQNSSTGAYGENIASLYIERKGYRIIERNFRTRTGEIDIIAVRPNKTISFIEVKCRVGEMCGKPYEQVTNLKMKRLSKTIQFYMLKKNLMQSKLTFEVISILLRVDKSIASIKHFENVEIAV